MRRTAALVAVVILTGSGVTACSSGSAPGGPTAATTPTGAPPGRGGQPGQGGQRQPAVSGLVAAVSGTTMQVQSQTKQTAVSWTPATVFTRQSAAALADVVAGACVVVRSAGGSGATPTSTGPLLAATVQIAPASADGTCGARADGLPGSGGPGSLGGSPDGAPAGAPSGMPSGAPRDGQGGFGGFGAFGSVVAVDGAGFTVSETLRTGASQSPTPRSVAVAAGPGTAYTKVLPATAGEVTVGRCASATGQTGATGALTAATVLLRDPVGGSCTGGAPTAGATGG